MSLCALKSRYTTGTLSDAPSGGWEHTQPGSIWHVEEQPSPSIVLPSSHSSPALARTMPSPQVEVQAPPGFLQSGSSVQKGLRPLPVSWTPPEAVPGSQPSVPSLTPSPQIVW